MAKKRRYVSEDNEANPYFEDFDSDADEEDKEYENVSDVPEYTGLTDEDLKLREGETEKERLERLRLTEWNRKQVLKENKNKVRSKNLKLDSKKKAKIIITAILSSLVLQFGNYYLYTTQIKYPDEMKYDENLTGRKCLKDWTALLQTRDGEVTKYLGETSYLEEEDKYANANETRLKFFKQMIDTISYKPEQKEVLNKYGNYYIDKDTQSVRYEESHVDVDEEVELYYVDYSKVPIDTDKIKKMMETEGIKLGDAGYSDKLIDIFCNYMMNLNKEGKLPITYMKRVPEMGANYDRSFYIKPEEDVFLDKLLFSSDEFHALLERFSLAAASNSKNPKWAIWNNYTDEQKTEIMNGTWSSTVIHTDLIDGEGFESESESETGNENDWMLIDIPGLSTNETESGEEVESESESEGTIGGEIIEFEEPEEYITELQPTAEWTAWNSSTEKKPEDEPEKYETGYVIPYTWCGSYFLQNEYVEYDENGNPIHKQIPAPLGDGTAGNPANIGTKVITSVSEYTYDEDGNRVIVEGGETYPISVELKEYGVSQEALDWFDSKDERNRGKDINSEVQYVYCVFEITNLSNKVINVADEMSLCDKNVNLFERTGTIFGLQDEIRLRPNESGIIETWSGATDLNKKYIIWGKTYAREKDVVWFRKLAGDLEDTSVNKGVYINRTRYGEERDKDK